MNKKLRRMNKENKQFYLSLFLIFVGVGLLIAGVSIKPIGIIDNSILIAFGEILTFAGALFGIDHKYRAKR